MARLIQASIIAVALLLAVPASATTVHGNFPGTNFDYLGVQETSNFGDPEPLFDVPSAIGDQLLFFPSIFSATAAGAGGSDQTGAELQTTIMSTGASTIDTITIDDFGDIDLSGTGAAEALISLAGTVTVLESISGGTCVGPSCDIAFTATYTPSSPFELPANLGLTLFQGEAVIDLVAAGFSDATKVLLTYDANQEVSTSAGSTALIQRKVHIVSTIAGTVPEPGSLLLLGSVALGASLARRSARRPPRA